MDPLFFGNSGEPLYGVYHKAERVSQASNGVVLFSPFGQEYMRSHRAMRQLATLLSRNGTAVLRFDYRGTGDSAGDLSAYKPDDWLDDAAVAIDELKELSGVSTVHLVGLRLGGLIAHFAALKRSDIQSVVLWDTVVSGEHYIDELTSSIQNSNKDKRSNKIATDGTIHFNGFALNRPFIDNLCTLNMTQTAPNAQTQTLQIASHRSEAADFLKLAWQNQQHCTYRFVEAPGDWNYVDKNGGILMPQQIIQSIVQHYDMEDAA